MSGACTRSGTPKRVDKSSRYALVGFRDFPFVGWASVGVWKRPRAPLHALESGNGRGRYGEDEAAPEGPVFEGDKAPQLAVPTSPSVTSPKAWSEDTECLASCSVGVRLQRPLLRDGYRS